MTRTPLLLSLVLLLSPALLGSVACAQVYEPGPRPLEVGDTGHIVLHDPARDRDLTVRIRYPEATEEHAGPFPLVVFSHGAGGSCDAFASLSETLAGHGYVVIHPTHSDSLSLAPRGERRSRGREILADPRSIVRGVNLPDRVADVKFILDSLDEFEQLIGQPGLLDREHMAMAGHSAGALTTQVLGGLRFFAGRRAMGASLGESRFGAFAVISGQGVNGRGITDSSWDGVERPWMVVTGSEDTSTASDETPETRRQAFEYAPEDGTKYLLFFEGAKHSSYQGKGPGLLLDGRPPRNLEWIESTTNAGVLAFFDAYVRGSENARAWLDSGAIAEGEGGTLEFQHK